MASNEVTTTGLDVDRDAVGGNALIKEMSRDIDSALAELTAGLVPEELLDRWEEESSDERAGGAEYAKGLNDAAIATIKVLVKYASPDTALSTWRALDMVARWHTLTFLPDGALEQLADEDIARLFPEDSYSSSEWQPLIRLLYCGEVAASVAKRMWCYVREVVPLEALRLVHECAPLALRLTTDDLVGLTNHQDGNVRSQAILILGSLADAPPVAGDEAIPGVAESTQPVSPRHSRSQGA